MKIGGRSCLLKINLELNYFSYNIEGIKDKWYDVNPKGNGFFKLVSK